MAGITFSTDTLKIRMPGITLNVDNRNARHHAVFDYRMQDITLSVDSRNA